MPTPSDYTSAPHLFGYCLNDSCSRAARCLRRQAALHLPPEREYFVVLNPSLAAAGGEACPYYAPDQPVRMAWGLTSLFAPLPHAVARAVKADMLAHFGASRFYRFKRKEYGLTPEQQAYVKRLFLSHGIESEPAYDEYRDVYVWPNSGRNSER